MQWYWWIPIGIAVVVVLWLLFRGRSTPYRVTSTPAQPGVGIDSDLPPTAPVVEPIHTAHEAAGRHRDATAGAIGEEGPTGPPLTDMRADTEADTEAAGTEATGASDSTEVTTATRGGTELSDKWDPIGRKEDREPFRPEEVADIGATEAARGPGGQGAAGPQPPEQAVGAPTGQPNAIVRDDARETPVPAVTSSAAATAAQADPAAPPATAAPERDPNGESPVVASEADTVVVTDAVSGNDTAIDNDTVTARRSGTTAHRTRERRSR